MLQDVKQTTVEKQQREGTQQCFSIIIKGLVFTQTLIITAKQYAVHVNIEKKIIDRKLQLNSN